MPDDPSVPPAGTPWTNRNDRAGRSPADQFTPLKEAVTSGGSGIPNPPPTDLIVVVDGGEEG